MNELALFAGAGGGLLGAKLLGWRTVAAVENDPYARDVLVARQNDGSLDPFPIWDDVCTFDGASWRGRIDVVSGGFPCQDISCAGKGSGIEASRSGLWREMARIVGEVRPRYVWVENVPALVQRGLAVVLGDLAEMGFDAVWGIVGADDAGAPHRRKRLWLLAYADAEPGRAQHLGEPDVRAELADGGGAAGQPAVAYAQEQPERARLCAGGPRGERWRRPGDGSRTGNAADTDGTGRAQQWRALADGTQCAAAECRGWWESEPDVGRVAHGVAARVDRLRCLGNGQVPQAMCLAWAILNREIEP